MFLLISAAAAPVALAEQRPKWELGAGGVFYTQPDYVGSDEYRFHAFPFPWIIYRGERLRLDRESVQTKIFGTDLVRLDLSASGQIAVDSDDNDRRHGMNDLDWIAQLGPTLKFLVTRSDDGRHALDVDVPLRVALAVDTDRFAYEGLVASPKLQYRYEPEGWRFEGNAGLEFSSNDYNEYIYGVTPHDATPGRRAYDPDGGYAGVRLSAGFSRYFGPIYAGVFARYINLDGATFEESPLVGSRHTFIGGIAIGWVWFKSKDMVPVGAEANLLSRRADESHPAAESDAASGADAAAESGTDATGAPAPQPAND
jgi:MipA family protein